MQLKHNQKVLKHSQVATSILGMAILQVRHLLCRLSFWSFRKMTRHLQPNTMEINKVNQRSKLIQLGKICLPIHMIGESTGFVARGRLTLFNSLIDHSVLIWRIKSVRMWVLAWGQPKPWYLHIVWNGSSLFIQIVRQKSDGKWHKRSWLQARHFVKGHSPV